jgi:transcriptional regulator with GAF, ATPase, and Fis domain
MSSPVTMDRRELERLRENPSLGAAAAEVLWASQQAADPATYLTAALPVVSAAAGAMFAAVASSVGGKWTPLAETGTRQSLPHDLLAEVLDQESAVLEGDWVAMPLAPRTGPGEAIVLRCAPGTPPRQAMATLAALGAFLNEGLRAVTWRHHHDRRLRRLETVLGIVQQWNRTRDVEPLLVQMAEAATRLLDADRASIFVWDRRAHTLVGRPALGVEGGELRVPDDRGVVGRVIQTGQPWRVDAAAEPQLVDRQVDKQLGYRTRTLLCVPLRGKSGELFGAFEVLNKRIGIFTAEDEDALVELAAHAAIALENAQDREQLLSNSRQITDQAAEQVRLIGNSPAMEALRSIIRRVAETDLAVLILGENGTGKEVVAQSIHYLSRRRDKPFIPVNCAAIPDTLAESELFGHEKGAFTDARETRLGKFELAAAGTLLLDEIGDLSLSGQAKLLRVLEEKVLVRVGGSTPIHTDARVLAATNQDLGEMVRQKRLREDLYFRLNVVTLEIPPLRERQDDIPLLAKYFLQDFCKKARRRMPEFSDAARQRLQEYSWPGNVRELRNLMERLAYLSAEDRIEAADLAFTFSPRGGPVMASVDQTLADATAQFQTDYIQRAIQQAGGNMSEAASQLGLHRSNLYRKMRQLRMAVPE